MIVAIATWSLHVPSTSSAPAVSIGGNAFQTAIANGAPLDRTPLPPLSVSIQANGGTLPPNSIVKLDSYIMRYYGESDKPARLDVIAIELPGSAQARAATFTVAHTSNPDWAPESEAIPLVATQAEDGTWYTLIPAMQLNVIHARSGDGWYVFTGVATRGKERIQNRFAVYLS